MARATRGTGPARERILRTAAALFYRQGYRATGINEIIEEAGVAKATFFAHFPTKEDLALAYLDHLHAQEAQALLTFVKRRQAPYDRFLAVIKWIEPWIRSNELRGCGFLNIVPEVPDRQSPLRGKAKHHYHVLRGLLRELTEGLLRSNPQAYGHLDAHAVADAYLLLVVGAIALTEISQETWPARRAVEAARLLVVP